MTARRIATGIAGAAALVGAGVLSVMYVYAGEDSSCGTVLYNTRTGGECGGPILAQRIAVLLLALTACACGLVWWLGRLSRRENRSVSLAVFMLAVAGLLLLGLVVRTLVDPGESASGYSCGSVLNPVILEGSIPNKPLGCNGYLSRQRSTAIAFIGAAAIISGAALSVARRSTVSNAAR